VTDRGFRILGSIHRAIYRATGGKVGGRMGKAPVLLLTTTGRKTGKPRTTPLLYARVGDGYVVIASKGGAEHDPLWLRNLQATPRAEVQVGRKKQQVQARATEGEERERMWRALTDLYGGYDDYAKKTSREIPVVLLEPATAMPDS
jgi:deazaflavin-dependent oxidoreductase (nitroreductase family)